jgi:hypothetical protein
MRLLSLIVICLWAGAARAQDVELNAAGMRYVFEQWAQEVGATQISLWRFMKVRLWARRSAPTVPSIWRASVRRSLRSVRRN